MAPTAIVTGVSRGIGRAIAVRLLADGYNVVGCSRSPGDAASALEFAGDRAAGIEADVSQGADVRRLVDAAIEGFGSIEVLINNAGTYEETQFLEISEQEWDSLLSINLKGAFLCGQAVAQTMVDSGQGGRIINISSSTGLLSEPNSAHYNVTKSAVISLTRSMAIDLAGYGILTNCVAPGWIDTGIDPALADFSDQQLLSLNPLGRAGSPEEVAQAVAMLCDPRAGFTNGATVTVDGGQTAMSPVPGG